MTELEAKQQLEKLRRQAEADAAAGKLDGETVRLVDDALTHPKAAAVVEELMGLEAHTVKAGDPAIDFDLPWLPGSEQRDQPTMTLSDHFGECPVALVFGSYT